MSPPMHLLHRRGDVKLEVSERAKLRGDDSSERAYVCLWLSISEESWFWAGEVRRF